MFIYDRQNKCLPRTLKTEQPPSRVIQDLRTVCHDMSAPINEMMHSISLQIHGQSERRKWLGGTAPYLETDLFYIKLGGWVLQGDFCANVV